jgi:hypothetical protein
MTYGGRLPEMPRVRPDAPPPRRRHPPGPPRTYSDEEIIAAILCYLAGETYASIAARLNCGVKTVISWCGSLTRARCATEAQRRWRKKLAPTA